MSDLSVERNPTWERHQGITFYKRRELQGKVVHLVWQSQTTLCGKNTDQTGWCHSLSESDCNYCLTLAGAI